MKWESRRRRLPEFALQEEMQNRNQEGTIEAAKKKPASILEEESAGCGGLVGYGCATSAFPSANSALAAASREANV